MSARDWEENTSTDESSGLCTWGKDTEVDIVGGGVLVFGVDIMFRCCN